MKEAAAYIRVSTEDQTEYSPDAQRGSILRYAAANGYLVREEHIFIDEGISGRKAEKRPAFMQMISRAKGKDRPFEAILVHKFDRFARSREDSVVYKSLLKKECGVRVISITESIEDDKFSIILEAMLEAMAEYYSINLGEEVKKGMTEKARRGGLQAPAPFGYQVKNHMLVPDEKEAPLVREIYNRFLQGEGYFCLAKWLNGLGVTTHRGGRMEHRTVEYILSNPTYIGKLRWNPSGRVPRGHTAEGQILTDGKHEPLIELDTWEAAQTRAQAIKLQYPYHARPASEVKCWFSGLVRCAACGSTLISAEHMKYWKCNNYIKGACRQSQHVRHDLLEKAILDRLEQDAKTAKGLDYTLVRLSPSGLDQASALQARLRALQGQQGRLRDAYLSGVETLEEYAKSKRALDDEAAKLQKELEAARRTEDPAAVEPRLRSMLADTLAVLCSSTATKEQKHSAARAVIARCTWDKSRGLLTIHYRFVAPQIVG